MIIPVLTTKLNKPQLPDLVISRESLLLMQLVLITREDPPFPLAKMRATKRLFELSISQLRFTEEEVKTYGELIPWS